ncbi:hypothetical protein QAD02_009409 [Eretmocerus hayati]|uniref:Uncharacterized protein n=1 Tax=Eretmocerus hayati TaxID=131215 RepID=A0ACC2N9L4_9HYME|nr:hypothetical protein QAD02_009409 [Eretmocerus hayati]
MLGLSVFHCLVFLSSIAITVSDKKTFQEILESPYIEDIFRLLQLKNLLSDYKNNGGIQEDCGRDLHYLSQSFDERESWASNMLDASSKIPSGIAQGNIIDLGMFDQCVNIKEEHPEAKVYAQHCMYSMNLVGDDNRFPLKPTMSACLPMSCSHNDLTQLIETAINKSDELKKLDISIASSTCTKNDDEFWDNGLVILMSISTVYSSILIICTIIDSIRGIADCKIKSKTLRTLSEFSLIRMGKNILSMDSNEGELAAINGMRFVSTASIVLLHSYFSHYLDIHVNFLATTEMIFSWRTLIIIYFGCSVDTFFILSGFLMTYTFFKKVQKTNKFNVPMHYVHRLIRLTPPAVVALFTCMIVVPKIASGPRWEWVCDMFISGLRTNWMYSLLYLQNFVDVYDFRLLHFWSLCVDMQLYMISPIILIALWKKPKIGLAIMLFLMVACQIFTASMVAVNKYPAFYLNQEWNFTLMKESFAATYPIPQTRATPWLFGIFMAYLVTEGVKPKKWVIPLGWILTLAITIWSAILGSSVLASPNYNAIRDIPLMLMLRLNWSIALCWIIYSSIHDCAGPIRMILTWKYFSPLSKISYSIYLVHALFPILRIGTTRSSSYLNDNKIFPLLLSDLSQAIFAAFFFSIFYEKPVLVLEKMIFSDTNKSSRRKEKDDERSRDLARYQ